MKYDVVIVGAGAAGLAAARDLTGMGKRVLLVEARGRIGGRVHTLHPPGLPSPIELGAEFIHGDPESTFALIDAAGLPVCELADTHWWSRAGKWERIPDFWGDVNRVRARIRGLTTDISFAEFIRRRKGLTPRLRERVLGYVEGYHAAHADRISTLALSSADNEQDAEQEGENHQYRPVAGYDGVIAALEAGAASERLDLRLGTVVTTVRWSEGAVTVECRSANSRTTETFRARALILTIPVGVWKAPREQEGAICFDPSLPDKERTLEKLESGHVVKIAFRFRERFWEQREHALNFLHARDPYVPTWWTNAPLRTPILTAWAGGTAADNLAAETPEGRIDRALDSMAAAFGQPRRKLAGLLDASWTHDWQSDPFSRGAYSYAGVGGSNAAAALARPIANTLFFAGEATSSDQTGTVAGAIDSGRRAAKELLRWL
jgi:monoamine oxidase